MITCLSHCREKYTDIHIVFEYVSFSLNEMKFVFLNVVINVSKKFKSEFNFLFSREDVKVLKIKSFLSLIFHGTISHLSCTPASVLAYGVIIL